MDSRGPWNEGGDWEFVDAPAFQEYRAGSGRNGRAEAEEFPASELLRETLIASLQRASF
jgi:Mn-containing catalase